MENSNDLNFLDLLRILFKNIILILISAVIFCGLAVFYAKHKASTQPYVARTSVVIYDPSNSKYDQYGVYNKELNRMKTYKSIAKNDVVLETVKSDLKKNYHLSLSVSDIKSAVTMKDSDQTTVLQIKAKSNKKRNAKVIANASAQAVKEDLNKYINAGNIKPLAPATLDSVQKDGVSLKKYSVVGLAFGFILGIAIALIKDVLLKQFKTRK